MKIPVTFLSEGQKVQGKFYHPEENGPPAATAILLPGFPGNEEDVLGIGQHLAQHGTNALMFNYRGTYQSEGTYSLKNTMADIAAALGYLNQPENLEKFHIDPEKFILGGYSYGGGMSLAYAAAHPDIKRVFSVAGTDHGEFAREYQRNPHFKAMIDQIFTDLRAPQGPVKFGTQSALDELTTDPAPYDLRAKAGLLADRDILLVGGWDDPNVTVDHHILPLYRVLQEAGAERVRIEAFQDDHALENCREALTGLVTGWVSA